MLTRSPFNPPLPFTEQQEDDYEDDDEYEVVSAEEGVQALDDDNGNGGSAAAGGGGDDEDDEDEDDEDGAYDDEDEDEDEEGSLGSEEEASIDLQQERAIAVAELAAAERLDRESGGGGARDLLRTLRRTADNLRPARLLATAGEGVSRVQRLACRLEGAGSFTFRLARRFVVRSARPALVALVAHRALRTLSDSRRACVRVGRLPRSRQQEYLFERAMGPDWREVMRQDMLEAIAEVDEGLNTEEVNEEKRAYQAAILRRLEVEEWDKERMRHYYYGLYGLGPWYWDMEERLHNPFFIGSRGWNMPIEAWVGRNKIFRRDVIKSQRTGDGVSDALRALGEERGQPIPYHVAKRVKDRETLTPGDALLTDPKILQVLGAKNARRAGGVAAAKASEAEVALRAREELEAIKAQRRREREEEEAKGLVA
jgi:hypothetical protein